jgi:xanthine dehydrogenase accessory factor
MPDDTVQAMNLDERCAVIALTHDPKLDDLALMEALKSPAFYVGALGSRANNAKRRETPARLRREPEEIARLHGPIGLTSAAARRPRSPFRSSAEVTAVKNGVALPDVATIAAAKEKLAPSVACRDPNRRRVRKRPPYATNRHPRSRR